ncbi:MAG: hypothetical protein J6Y62_01415 [Clostridia bacterium]|nr:hypothetical protein [Clostridia bacterium]
MSKDKTETVKCRVCGKADNGQGRRGGMCLDCYCDFVAAHMYDDKGRGRHPSLEEVSRMAENQETADMG